VNPETIPDLTEEEIKALVRLHGWYIGYISAGGGRRTYRVFNENNWCVGEGNTLAGAYADACQNEDSGHNEQFKVSPGPWVKTIDKIKAGEI